MLAQRSVAASKFDVARSVVCAGGGECNGVVTMGCLARGWIVISCITKAEAHARYGAPHDFLGLCAAIATGLCACFF